MSISLSSLLNYKADDFIRLVTSPLAQISFSQWGEDAVLQHLLLADDPQIARGWYVDCGCHHPQQYSNTMLLHMRGWTGINIDANPEYIRLFNECRPRDINVWSGVGVANEERDFYRFEIGAVSTLSERQAAEWQSRNGWKLRDIVKIQVRTINDLLTTHLPAGQRIDYLNIDIEGLDREVVAQMDFVRFRPRVLSVELHGLSIVDSAGDPTVALLRGAGYELVSVCVATFFFVLRDGGRGV
jgi:FkbM family methyltransferase